MFSLLLRIAVLGLVVGAGLAWVRLGVWRARRSRQEVEAARRAFARDAPALAEVFRAAAERTGKPRGLHWERVDLSEGPPTLARDAATGELVALVDATIAFSAVVGGDMEEVEAVGNLRSATAVFAWRDARWRTDGRAVFNLSPGQTLERYRDSLTAAG